jgi:hypothetical protein
MIAPAMKGRFSCATVFALGLAVALVRSYYPQRQVLAWDVFGYYLYLPAAFIHNDIALRDRTWTDRVMTTYAPSSTFYQLVDGSDGARVIRYGSGMAMLYAPFFAVAHLLAEPLGFPADGFSPPYQVAVTLGCLAIAWLGLLVLRAVLLRFFDDRWTAVLLLLIGLGTNWFQLTAWDGTLLSHSALFTLYALLLFTTIHWHERPTRMMALGIGVVLGLITLVRPSELVAVSIPVLWGVAGPDAQRSKWRMVRAHVPHLVMAAIAFALVVAPQLLYWRLTAGQWLFYSYVNPGEGLDLATPHLRPFLISFRKGWFVYTPLMMFAILGLATLRKRLPQAFWSVLIFLVVDVWIVSSWSCWWYAGGSFSARAMVPAYPVLALPLGTFLQWAWRWRGWRMPVVLAGVGFVALNLFQTWQWTAGIISKERMTKAYYKAVFGRTHMPVGADTLLLVQRPLGNEERFTDERRYRAQEVFRADHADHPDGVFTLTDTILYTPAFETTFEGLTAKDHVWIRPSMRFWVGDGTSAVPTMVVHFEHEGGTYKYMAREPVVPAGVRDAWVSFTMDYITPEVRARHDKVKVYLWNRHGATLRVDDLVVLVFEPR